MDEDSCKNPPKGNNLKDFNKRQRYKADSDYVLRKRVPPLDVRRNNDIYITNKSDFKVFTIIFMIL